MDNVSKALAFLFIAIGSGIFILIMLIKMDVVTKKAEAQVKEVSAETEWQGYLFQKVAQEALTRRGQDKSEGK
jgi:putative ribosome biogenesis GTPase RsgA